MSLIKFDCTLTKISIENGFHLHFDRTTINPQNKEVWKPHSFDIDIDDYTFGIELIYYTRRRIAELFR